MESQPQNPEFKINPENFPLCPLTIASKKSSFNSLHAGIFFVVC